MELTIGEQQKQQAFNRTILTAHITVAETTPTRQEVADLIAKKLSVQRELVLVTHIYQRYGEPKADVSAVIYSDVETMKRIERGNLIEKNAVKTPEATESAEE